jgi:serine/threonine protein kinase
MFKHECIVTFFEAFLCDNEKTLWTVREYMDWESMTVVLEKYSYGISLNEFEIAYVAKQVCELFAKFVFFVKLLIIIVVVGIGVHSQLWHYYGRCQK